MEWSSEAQSLPGSWRAILPKRPRAAEHLAAKRERKVRLGEDPVGSGRQPVRLEEIECLQKLRLSFRALQGISQIKEIYISKNFKI